MALFGLGGLGGMRQQGNPQQGGQPQEQGWQGLGALIGMGGEDPRSAAKRQMFLNGFRTEIGSIPTFGENVPQAAAQGFTIQRTKQQDALAEQERADAADAKAKLAEFAMQKVHPSLRSLAESQPELALQMNEQMQPAAPTSDWAKLNDGTLFNQRTGETMAAEGYPGAMADPPKVETRFNPQTGQEEKVQWDPQEGWVPFGGQKSPTAAGVPMNPTIQKELFEAEDAVSSGGFVLSALDSALELNKTAADGAWAGQRATVGANIPDIGVFNGDQTDQATIEYQNTVNELALNQLKTIFGAAPTEGERKILLDIQGSVDQPRAVREQILRRARTMAERRIAEARRKADALRTGDYFTPGYGQQQPSEPGVGVDDILRGYGL